MDPFGAIANIFLGYLKGKALQKWAALLFEIWFSMTLTFLFVGGTILASTAATGKTNWALAIGNGMWVAAVVGAAFFRQSPLTKGMKIVLPIEEAAKEMNINLQTIEKEK